MEFVWKNDIGYEILNGVWTIVRAAGVSIRVGRSKMVAPCGEVLT